ncbi:MAG: MoxR family ATPase, partial [Planctomycetota bacterium]
KLYVELPGHDDFSEILNRTGGNSRPEINPVASGEDILEMGRLLRDVPIDKQIQDYLIRIVRATHPTDSNATTNIKKYVRYGSSPRGAQAVLAASKARALLDGRYHVASEDINRMALPALRHRVLLSFEGEAEGKSTDEVIRDVIEEVK